VILSIN